MTARLEIAPAITPDPNATPRADIVDDGKGGVRVDPSKTPVASEKPAVAERPAGLPDKFKTVEDMVKSYNELEKKQGTKPAVETPVTPTPITPEAATKAGIDLPALAKEFADKGEFSAETLQVLKDKGFDKATVDAYVAGQTAISEKLVSDLQSVAGGEKAFTATLEWAKANLSADDKAAYNAAIDTGDIKLAKLALQAVVAQYTEANGKVPSLVTGGERAGSGDVQPYGSNAELVADMKTEKYKKDPAFRAKVEARLAVTNYGPR